MAGVEPPGVAQRLVESYLAAADSEAPGLVEGLYLVGSVALGDFHPTRSDVDFVAVLREGAGAEARPILERVHARLRAQQRRPCFDGIYVTWRDLASDPRAVEPGPYVQDGAFRVNGRSERHPVTWHLLGQQGICCRGPAVGEIALWRDAKALAAWTNENLDTYWRRLLRRGQRFWTWDGLAGLTAWSCAWCVLGVSRLYYTLATGEITSKDGAGHYALATFAPRWSLVIQEALRIRHGIGGRSLYRSPMARRRDVRAFVEMVIVEGHGVYAERWAGSLHSAWAGAAV